MSRREILADTLARLEAERCLPVPAAPKPELRGWTPEEQAEHRQVLLDALSGDPVLIAWRERDVA